MPRQTRAAARAQEPEADVNIATDETATDGPDTTLQETKATQRPALVELTANIVEEIEDALDSVDAKDVVKPGKETKKAATGKGTNKGTTRGKNKKPKKVEEFNLDQKEEECAESTSMQSEVDRASEHLSARHPDGSLSPSNIVNDADMDNSHTGSSEELIVEPSMGSSEELISVAVDDGADDEKYEIKPSIEEHVSSPDGGVEAARRLESLFQKPIDEDENAMTNIVEAASTPLPPSPVKKAPQSAKKVQQNNTKTAKKSVSSSTKATPPVASSNAKKKQRGSVSRAVSSSTVRRSTQRSSTSVAQDQISKKDQAPTSKPRSEIAALNTPPRVSKSTKPATRPTFTLPSDGIKEKLKAQKEERQKRQEEIAAKMADKKQKQGVSIPPPRKTSDASKPTDNKTDTVKRTSSVRGRLNSTPNKPKPAVLEAQKRASTLVNRTRPSISASTPGGKSTTKKQPAPVVRENRAATLRRTGSVGAVTTVKPRTSSVKVPEKKENVKLAPSIAPKKEEDKVFNKAEAAKQARAAAAEKGRAASREWAEKKRREMEAKKLAARGRVVDEGEGKENVDPVGA